MEKTYGGKFSSKFIARSRDPKGQIQGQSIGQQVIKPKHVPTKKVMADLESLCNFLSKNTNFNQFDLKVTDLWSFEYQRSGAF